MVRRSQSAFFNLGPAVLLPLPDGLLVALQGFANRTLAGPVKLAQDAPDMVLVVPHSGPVFDEVAHAARGPQPGSKSECFGTTLERVFDPAQLGRAELGPPSGVLGLAQAAHAGLLQFARPTADRLPMHPHHSGDLGLAESLFK